MLEEKIEDAVVELLRRAATELPEEYVNPLREELEETEGDLGRSQLENILEDIELASKMSKPMCQDTGIVAFLVEMGDGFPLRSELKGVLIEATKRATEEVPLRPNAVDMFEGNTGDNVGLRGYVPIIYMDLVPGDKLHITAIPKGGGSSNVADHGMLKPGVGIKGVKEFVVKAISKAGSLGCPPYFVGVGVGGGEDLCMKLAKEALLKPFRERSEDPEIAEIERDLLDKVNQLGIGAMGFGEGTTALDLHIEMAARHPASLPVGVVLSCWALRHASATIDPDGEVVFE
ncbi:MAG: fumarate hydratase [Candidatus Bathyarchaeia archaeon]